MPTGYTSGVQNGKITTFEQYAIGCMRAFLVDMKESGLSDPIEAIEPSDYHSKEFWRCSNQLADIRDMTDEQIELALKAETELAEKEIADRKAGKTRELERYSAMMSIAKSYIAPTKEHSKFRQFMIEQLGDSIEHDCRMTELIYPKAKTPAEWREGRIEYLMREMSYHYEKNLEEIKHCAERNEWVLQAMQSIREHSERTKAARETEEKVVNQTE